MSTGHSNAYCKYYTAQHGGEIPVYRGCQFGAGVGLGDILSTLRNNLTAAQQRGDPDARGAILGTLKSLAQQAMPRLYDALTKPPERQTGSGAGARALLSGEDGVPLPGTSVRKRQHPSGPKHRNSTIKKRRAAAKLTNNHYNF
jgi:hypothetical protein